MSITDTTRPTSNTSVIPGVLLASVIGVLAWSLARVIPLVGAPVVAIVLGVLVALVRPVSPALRPGVHAAAKRVLQASIVVLGLELSWHEVLQTGVSSLPVLLGTLVVALVGAGVVGRLVGIRGDLRTLIGVGTAICGASAIAATDAVIDAHESDVAYAVATIFTFNVAAVLTFPSVGHLLHLSPHAFGVWAGTAVNDVSSVVAASSAFGHGASSTAVVVKLARSLAIVPIALGLSLWRTRQVRAEATVSRAVLARRAFPWFILWFLAAVGLDSAGVVPHSWTPSLGQLAQLLIAVALAGVGLSVRPREIRSAGWRPLALGAILWILVAASSLLIAHVTGN
ncbi:MAG: putative sulfate exporter family transporter [Acidimicrobiaceae bacterium]|nr:putative sulfate exporter family transporter [Acidimicrobiaceae bacterium]